jgi:hypothetical protein
MDGSGQLQAPAALDLCTIDLSCFALYSGSFRSLSQGLNECRLLYVRLIHTSLDF